MHGHGWDVVTADKIVNAGPMVLYGFILRCSVTGAAVSLYEGLDAESGRFIGTHEGLANVSLHVDLFGIHLDRGLFVDIGTNVDSVLVVYDVIPIEGE